MPLTGKSLLAPLAGAALLTVGPLSASPAASSLSSVTHAPLVPVARGMHAASQNWSGYSATSGPFTSVSASWQEPVANCTFLDLMSASSFWVGIDGNGSKSVEQIGTDSDCNVGAPTYYAWYEIYPASPIMFSDPVSPGDWFNASVNAAPGGNFTLVLNNATQGWTETVQASYPAAQLHSAEVIAEAPSLAPTPFLTIPLTNFGNVTFTNARVNGQPLGWLNPESIVMEQPLTGSVKARPGYIWDGTVFSVTWKSEF